jgi:uncharacterized membrane protein YkvA (DUF1232 family)
MSHIKERLKARKSVVKRLKSETHALSLAYKDPRVPWYAKLLGALVVAYALSPIDLIPDFIPVLGYVDDLVLVPAGIALAIKMIPKEVMDDLRQKARENLRSEKPHWVAAAVIVLIWLLIIAWIVTLVLR